ncbi:hypothetical protein [Micromonospora aurantiaca (nom. illeg.)]|uniref:hypothetical protein n=1 Tax=Micromonospora aurantiaca (nom. illeg.) TaxID=47850 RepID=UPI00340EC8B5
MSRTRTVFLAAAVAAALILVWRGLAPEPAPPTAPTAAVDSPRAAAPPSAEPGVLSTAAATATPTGPPTGPPTVGVGAAEGGEDGVRGRDPAPPPAAGITTAATVFAQAWLRAGTDPGSWHAGLAGHATTSLAATLADVDPARVPARRLAGPATVLTSSPARADVAVPCDTGTLGLRLVLVDGQWLVDAVDWQPR